MIFLWDTWEDVAPVGLVAVDDVTEGVPWIWDRKLSAIADDDDNALAAATVAAAAVVVVVTVAAWESDPPATCTFPLNGRKHK